MANGNLNVAVNKAPNNEIGLLADSLKDTISNLQGIINDISDQMETMAAGDMTGEITREYVGDFANIKNSITKISGALNNTLSSINIAAEQVNSGADQVATAAQSLSQGATEQASSIEELSSSIMSVSEQVNENAKNVNVAGSYVQESQNGTENSNQDMHQMMEAMNDINDSSTQISKIIKVIDDIAFQTNILALNAAVEAARAGAAGKGFSVVADEVRNLASKSADAAKQTTILIEGSVSSVGKGMEIAQETAKALETVRSQSEMVVQTIKKIQEASNEQAEAINQITIGLEQISSVVQTNSATSQESAAASEELSGQAQMLREEISQFKLKNTYNGSSSTASSMSSQSAYSAPSMGMNQSSSLSISLDDDKY
jgi:methyl-accepting chemotaxis protein